MKTILCTLFNSNYLDKGLVLYDSLCECTKNFKLYILCMDDMCYDVLLDLKQEHIIPIKLADFEKNDDDLLEAKRNRNFGEYCWTCTASLILYVINKYKEEICTYIDADMYFYHDPQILVDEMIDANKSVLIIPHRFSMINKYMEKNGKYCVEFNTFRTDTCGMRVLRDWRNDCIDCCTSLNDGKRFGDQKYLDKWSTKYDCVHVCENLGAGVAPWNIQSYRFFSGESVDNKVRLKTKNKLVDLVFYHYQNLDYIDRGIVKLNVYPGKMFVDKKLVKSLYEDYLKKIEKKRECLKNNYYIEPMVKKSQTFDKESSKLLCQKIKGLNTSKILYFISMKLFRHNDYMRILS